MISTTDFMQKYIAISNEWSVMMGLKTPPRKYSERTLFIRGLSAVVPRDTRLKKKDCDSHE